MLTIGIIVLEDMGVSCSDPTAKSKPMLMTIPSKIRMIIWRLLMLAPNARCMKGWKRKSKPDPDAPFAFSLSVPRTCKLTHMEAAITDQLRAVEAKLGYKAAAISPLRRIPFAEGGVDTGLWVGDLRSTRNWDTDPVRFSLR